MDKARRALREVFGFTEFLEGQEPVIAALLEGRSALAIFPTGGGKSLCYQVPALLLDGLTVVVSPLIALMKDQVDALQRRGVSAARLDSSLDAAQAREVFDRLRDGRLTMLYLAPERLASERLERVLAARGIALLAIDEAHCISAWGHNFRPEYLKLARLAGQLNVGRVLALTATATPEVSRDVAKAFAIAEDDIVRTGFHRPNLELNATPCREDQRWALLLERIKGRPPGPAIVYVTLQKTAEELAAFLLERGLPAVAYHAGLGDDLRHEIQDRFMASPTAIVVATIAFGMGIDKADVRAVYHANLPKGLESYAQEVGRAGRDGKPSYCELFACAEDVVTLENFSHGDTPSPESIAAFLTDVLGRGRTFDVSTYELSNDHDIRPLVVQTLLTYLELEGVLGATGPFYAEYKIQTKRPLEEVVGRFDERRATFLRRLFELARRGTTWLSLDVVAAASTLDEPRDRIVKALNYLEEQGEVVLQVAGLRHGYRLVRAAPDVEGLRETMVGRFLEREARDVARVRQAMEFAQEKGCLARRLLAHFGEVMERDCGHCGRCLGREPSPLPLLAIRPLGQIEREMIDGLRAEGRPALASSRQMTRFLCGLSSPASSRAKLGKHPRYGILADVPFARVLAFVEGAEGDGPRGPNGSQSLVPHRQAPVSNRNAGRRAGPTG